MTNLSILLWHTEVFKLITHINRQLTARELIACQLTAGELIPWLTAQVG